MWREMGRSKKLYSFEYVWGRSQESPNWGKGIQESIMGRLEAEEKKRKFFLSLKERKSSGGVAAAQSGPPFNMGWLFFGLYSIAFIIAYTTNKQI